MSNGLRRLEIRDFFSGTFKTPPIGALEKILTAGSPITTPPPERMLRDWNRPWIYARVFAVGMIFIAASVAVALEGLSVGISMLRTVSVFVTPLTLLTFFWESNIPRNISVYKVIGIFLIGGMLSLFLTPLFGHGNIPNGSAQYAAFTEEPAKVFSTAIFIYIINPRYIFSGILIGASVGAGFSAFESLDYVINAGNPIGTLIVRSANILDSHLMWAGIEGGALVWVKGDSRLGLQHLADTRFLKYLAATMAMHFSGNYDLYLMRIPIFGDIKYILLGFADVYVMSTLFDKAILQILEISNFARQSPTNLVDVPKLIAVSGPLAKSAFPLKQRLTIGRDPSVCNVIFPPNTPGISRRHCSIECRADGVYLIDLGSTAGVFLQTGKRLPVNKWVKVSGKFYLGSPAVTFSVS